MANAIIQSNDLNQIRQELYGNGASLTFYSVTPGAGEQQIATLSNGWVPWRKQRLRDDGVSGAVTIMLASSVGVNVERIRENAVVDVNLNGQIKRYKVAEITTVQQLGGGWIIHCEPLSNTV